MSTLTALLADLLVHAEEALNEAGQPVGASVIVNGDVAWDEYCDGLLYVRFTGATPVGGSPRCPLPFLDYQIFVGVLRCATPFADEEGNPPPTSVLTEEALGVVRDGEAIQKGITCDLDWRPYGDQRSFPGWTTFTPQGGMAGGEWEINVRIVPGCGC